MSTDIDLYDVLSLENDCIKTDIKAAYIDLVKKHHPDKGGDADMFELITHAFNVLFNDDTRSEYDKLTRLEQQTSNDYEDLAQSSRNYAESQTGNMTEEEKEIKKTAAQIEFDKSFEDMDKKHKFVRDGSQMEAITEDDAIRQADDLKLSRENEKCELEIEQEKLFENSKDFDLAKFNEMFDMAHKSEHEIVRHTGNPGAWNGNGVDDSYTSYSTNYGDIYNNDNNNVAMTGSYSGINVDSREKTKISKSDLKNVQGASYVSDHNIVDDDYNASLEQRMKEYTNDLKSYDDRHFNDFDKTVDEFGIFNNLGIENAVTGFDWGHDKEEMTKAHTKLLKIKKKEKCVAVVKEQPCETEIKESELHSKKITDDNEEHSCETTKQDINE
jgi:curved DNA-binding protein CbpA